MVGCTLAYSWVGNTYGLPKVLFYTILSTETGGDVQIVSVQGDVKNLRFSVKRKY